jgi:Rhodopirellula transposase DDE domain
MQADVRWTNLSRRAIARAVTVLGTPISHHIAGRWLRANGFRRRQTQKKQTMGSHADRNKQFERIAALKSEYVNAGNPMVSIDTKKKELLGKFFRAGKLECKDTILVNDHDFPSAGDGKLIPHGILDLAKNLGSIHLNTSHDTSEFACASLELWWHEEGRAAYPNATTLLVLCDGGGSNSATAFVFKEDLQALADRLGIKIRIAHFPPYCSKFNPIEHRLFPHVTRALQGVVLESVEIAKRFMEKTSTSTGLKVTVRCLEKVFLTGRKCAEDFRDSMRIVFDSVLPKWNYVAVPGSG